MSTVLFYFGVLLKLIHMKTIVNKHTLLLSVLHDEVNDFGIDYVLTEILPLVAPSFSDEALAEQCNMVVFRPGYFVSK